MTHAVFSVLTSLFPRHLNCSTNLQSFSGFEQILHIKIHGLVISWTVHYTSFLNDTMTWFLEETCRGCSLRWRPVCVKYHQRRSERLNCWILFQQRRVKLVFFSGYKKFNRTFENLVCSLSFLHVPNNVFKKKNWVN